jgi:hypothetical protein
MNVRMKTFAKRPALNPDFKRFQTLPLLSAPASGRFVSGVSCSSSPRAKVLPGALSVALQKVATARKDTAAADGSIALSG